MSEISRYESRRGMVSATSAEIFRFITDIRNFEQLIRSDNLTDLSFEADSITFKAGMLGTVDLRISSRTEFSEVCYTGNAMQVKDFTISVVLNEQSGGKTEVRMILSAMLNPLLKMVAADPIRQFLDRIISEMENYRGWQNIRSRTQAP